MALTIVTLLAVILATSASFPWDLLSMRLR
jgi:hypothetical protein